MLSIVIASFSLCPCLLGKCKWLSVCVCAFHDYSGLPLKAKRISRNAFVTVFHLKYEHATINVDSTYENGYGCALFVIYSYICHIYIVDEGVTKVTFVCDFFTLWQIVRDIDCLLPRKCALWCSCILSCKIPHNIC